MTDQPNVDPKVQNAYQRIIVAGLKVMYDPSMQRTLMSGIAQDASPAQIAATEVAGVLRILDDKHKNQLPKQALYPAGMFLMLDLMKFMEEAGRAKIADKDVMEASRLLLKTLIAEYGLLDRSAAARSSQQAPAEPTEPTDQQGGIMSSQAPTRGTVQQPQGLMGA